MIRIIHYLPNINYASGIAQLIMRYYRKINKNYFQFHFVYFSNLKEKNFQKEIIELGGTEKYICAPNKPIQFSKDFNNFIKNFKKNYKGDEIIFHNHQLPFTIFQYGILKKNNIDNIIVHNHMTKFSDKKLSAFRNMLLFLPVSFLNVRYFACSDDSCDLISKYNFINKRNIFVLKNGIDCEYFRFSQEKRDKMRENLKISNEYVIGNIGRFEVVKNQKFIIRLFYKKFNEQNYKLLLVGDGSNKKALLKEIEKYNLKKQTIILGDRSDISNILCSIDCFLFPSKFEGLGIAAIEAQANGVPVIISKHVPSEVIINNCIKKCDYSINSWAKTIEQFRRRRINRLAMNKYISRSEYNINNNIMNLENEYKKIINRNI